MVRRSERAKAPAGNSVDGLVASSTARLSRRSERKGNVDVDDQIKTRKRGLEDVQVDDAKPVRDGYKRSVANKGQRPEGSLTASRKSSGGQNRGRADNANVPSGSNRTVAEVKADLLLLAANEDATSAELQSYLHGVSDDHIDALAKTVAQVRRKIEKQDEERQRLATMMQYEEGILQDQIHKKTSQKSVLIVGVDEVGVGPLAGPIVSCAVAFKYPLDEDKLRLLQGINDSKRLSQAKRETLDRAIREDCAVAYHLGIVTAAEVDKLNTLQASREAMNRAVRGLTTLPTIDHILVDHHEIPGVDAHIPQTSITKGDSKSIVIAAASIVAKVYRDDYMKKLHASYPHFAFDRNAGYGTSDHLLQLKLGRTCPEHRVTFAPVQTALRKAQGAPANEVVLPTKRAKRKAEDSDRPQKRGRRDKSVAEKVHSEQLVSKGNPPVIFSLAWWTSWWK